MDRAVDHIEPAELQRLLGDHLALYRRKTPYYQAAMLDGLLSVWEGHHINLLDIGGGTGVIAEAMARFLPVGRVHTIDLVNRFCPTLSVTTGQYDGRKFPFADGEFEAATLNNVVHHVPVEARVDLLREIRRVVRGPLYIKDHQKQNAVDGLRLTALDAIGNIPFGGMLWARYLTWTDWEELAKVAGYRISARTSGRYRAFPFAVLFPNRLEVTMRLNPL